MQKYPKYRTKPKVRAKIGSLANPVSVLHIRFKTKTIKTIIKDNLDN
jgi:hypothetical protein